jgi:uncharacterized protein
MDKEAREMLNTAKTIAVVGLSANPERTSYRVAKYMQDQGYRIIPVNPSIKESLGEKAYASLKEVPEKIDVVNIFRRSEDVPPVVDEAISVKAKGVWMQEGIINEEAAALARKAGLKVVMDSCIMVQHSRLEFESKKG